MDEIIENIKSIQDELEIKVQDYNQISQSHFDLIDNSFDAILDDKFFEVYLKEKPFQIEVGRIKKSNF